MRQTSDKAARTIVTGVAWLTALLAATATEAAPDGDALIARLARTAPASIAFVEVRFSALLVEPLVVGGTLDYRSAGELERRVETPYREVTTIRGDTVHIERPDEPPRAFALRRSPELRAFLAGMVGLLTGDGAFIREHFAVVASGDDARWQLELAPTDGRMRQQLRAITVAGAADEPRCFVTDDVQGGSSVMLLGAAAARPLKSPLARDELLATCAAE